MQDMHSRIIVFFTFALLLNGFLKNVKTLPWIDFFKFGTSIAKAHQGLKFGQISAGFKWDMDDNVRKSIYNLLLHLPNKLLLDTETFFITLGWYDS